MGFLIGSALAALVVTLAAARYVVGHWPSASFGTQVFRAALSFPLLVTLLFAGAALVTMLQPAPANRPDLDSGMPIFALFFFLIYALFVGGVVGVPTAYFAVRGLRAS